MPSHYAASGGAPAPKLGPAPPSLAQTVANAVHQVAQATQHVAATAVAAPNGDIQSSGSGYGSAQADAYKASPAYQHAIAAVYHAQSPAQQKAILAGAAKAPNTPEAKAVFAAKMGVSPEQYAKLGPAAVSSQGRGVLGSVEHAIGAIPGLVGKGSQELGAALGVTPFGPRQAPGGLAAK